jgi:single-strand DNA-binding protein
MNVFTATGNLGRDVETRQTANGTTVATFPIAVSSGYGDNKKTTWVRCALFGKRAEGGLIQYLAKGTQVAVTGEISLNEFTDKEGQQRSSLELRVNELDLIGGKPSQSNSAPQPAAANAGPDYGSPDDSDIPF